MNTGKLLHYGMRVQIKDHLRMQHYLYRLENMNLYGELKKALGKEIRKHHLSGQNINVRCKVLSPEEAIGKPNHDDYPLVKGREVMIEAVFKGAKGQAFTDEFENADFPVDELMQMKLNSNRNRSFFISGLNAVFNHLKLCDKAIHCVDDELEDCAHNLSEFIGKKKHILLVGHQPRFLEELAVQYNTRVIDLDKDNIGSVFSGISIEPPEMTPDAIKWSDLILATGSTVVNGTITDFLSLDKPVIFYGVTISAAAGILNLNRYCHCGH